MWLLQLIHNIKEELEIKKHMEIATPRSKNTTLDTTSDQVVTVGAKVEQLAKDFAELKAVLLAHNGAGTTQQ